MVNFSKINKRQIFVAFFLKNIKILILLQFFAILCYPIIRIEWYIMRKIILFFFLIFLIKILICFASSTHEKYPNLFLFANCGLIGVTIFLFLASYIFGFCKWHRIIITAIILNKIKIG